MDFALTEEQPMSQDSVRRFATNELAPRPPPPLPSPHKAVGCDGVRQEQQARLQRVAAE
jgi:hypothetical protein